VNSTTVIVIDSHPIFRIGLRAALSHVADIHVLADWPSRVDLGLRLDAALPDLVVIDAGIALQADILPVLLAARERDNGPKFIVVLDAPTVPDIGHDEFWDAVVHRTASVEHVVATVQDVAGRPRREPLTSRTWWGSDRLATNPDGRRRRIVWRISNN